MATTKLHDYPSTTKGFHEACKVLPNLQQRTSTCALTIPDGDEWLFTFALRTAKAMPQEEGWLPMVHHSEGHTRRRVYHFKLFSKVSLNEYVEQVILTNQNTNIKMAQIGGGAKNLLEARRVHDDNFRKYRDNDSDMYAATRNKNQLLRSCGW